MKYLMNDREIAVAYAKELRKWYKEKELDPKAPAPPLPRPIALDPGLGGRRPHADSLEGMAKDGHFDSIRVVIFHEKHGERYYLVKEQEDFGRMALEVIQDRKKCGFYDYTIKVSDLQPEPPKVTMEQAATMDEAVQRTVQDLWTNYKRAKQDMEGDLERVTLLKKALDGDAIAAVRLLVQSRGYEHEAFEIVIPKELS